MTGVQTCALPIYVGQVLEVHLGLACKQKDWYIATPVFDGAGEGDIIELLKDCGYPESGKERSLNGQLYGRLKPFASETAIIEAVGWSYQPGKLYGVDHIIAINIQSKSGIIRHRDNVRARKIWAYFQDLIKRYKKDKSSLEASYAAARPWLTSVKYWKEYLDL